MRLVRIVIVAMFIGVVRWLLDCAGLGVAGERRRNGRARSRVVADIPTVNAHEEFNSNDLNSHSEVYIRVFLQPVRVATESLVADPTSLTAEPLRVNADSVAGDVSIRITHDPATNPYRTNYTFNYDPTVVIR